MTDTRLIFNGDTASGRAQWVPWLRSLALTLDEWAWSVLQNDVLPHGKVKKIMDPAPASIAVADVQPDEVEAVADRMSKRSAAALVSPADEGLILDKPTDEEFEEAKMLPYARLTGIVNYIMAKLMQMYSCR